MNAGYSAQLSFVEWPHYHTKSKHLNLWCISPPTLPVGYGTTYGVTSPEKSSVDISKLKSLKSKLLFVLYC